MNETIIPIAHIIATLTASVAAVVSVAYKFKQNKEISALKEQIRLLTEIPLTRKNGVLYDKDGWPFCPVCHGKERHNIPLKKLKEWPPSVSNPMPAKLHCHACSYQIDDPERAI